MKQPERVRIADTPGARCAHCGRPDQPDAFNRCKGCGAPHAPSEPIDVTTFADRERWVLWV